MWRFASAIASFSLLSVPFPAGTSELEELSDLTLAIKYIEWIKAGDVDQMFNYLSPNLRTATGRDGIVQLLKTNDGDFGRPQTTLLARVDPFQADCVRRAFASTFDRGRGWTVVLTCPEENGWRVAGFHLQPDVATTAATLFRGLISERLGIGFLHHRCDIDPAMEKGETIQCVAIAGDGGTHEFVIQYVDTGQLEVTDHQQVSGAMGTPSSSLLQVLSQSLISDYSRRQFSEIYQGASIALQDTVPAQSFIAQLKFHHEAVGPVQKATLKRHETDKASGLPRVYMSAEYGAGHHGEIEFSFMPERGEWKLLGIDFHASLDGDLFLKALPGALDQTVRDLLHDPTAQVNCSLDPAPEAGQTVQCPGRAFDREITYSLILSDGEEDGIEQDFEIWVDDFHTMLRATLESYEDLLGWSVDSLQCASKTSDAELAKEFRELSCDVGSNSGSVSFVVATDGKQFTILDVKQN